MRRAVALPSSWALIALIAAPAVAQQAEGGRTDLGAFTREIMVVHRDGAQKPLAMRTPFEFFVESGVVESGEPREVVEKEIAFLKSYLTLIAYCVTKAPSR